MAPISPIDRKRASPSQSQSDSGFEEPSSKRHRTDSISASTQTVEKEPEIVKALHQSRMFNDDPHQLLLRSIALALEHVGFEAASPEALEAFCAEVESYSTHFLQKVTTSMLSARRSQSTPLDFEYALSEFNLPGAFLEPHLRPPIPRSKTQIQLEALPMQEPPKSIPAALLGVELNGELEKRQKHYIPKQFPSFPSKHTYKWTEKPSARETDPRKIREEAAKAARQGEEALRRLTKVAKAGKEKDVKNAASKDPNTKERHDIWERTMQEFSMGKRDYLVGKVEEDDRSMVVNADRRFYRKGPPPKRRVAVPEIQP